MDVQTGHAGAQDAVGAPCISRHLRAPDRPQDDHPDGSDAWAPAKPRPDETLIRALARTHRWRRLIENGTYRSAVEIAEAEKITRSFVNRLLRLTLLAPDIQEAIIDGRQPKGMQLEDLTRPLPSDWKEQRLGSSYVSA